MPTNIITLQLCIVAVTVSMETITLGVTTIMEMVATVVIADSPLLGEPKSAQPKVSLA